MSQRSVFEDVGNDVGAAALAPLQRRDPARRAISLWLVLLAVLVAVMVLVGGATRLTDSGLSITEWAPVMGTLPPLSAADWDAAFVAYKTTTEWEQQNNWMTLADFKPIFWWEWGHRFLGRFIGLVWFLGFAWFALRGTIPDRWTGRLLLVGALGGLQGAIGWWMVASGLSERVDVAPYRLAVHLGVAFLIFALLIWYALRIRSDEVETLKARRLRKSGLMWWSGAAITVTFVQILSGALVAGLDAGRGHIDWPLMEGQFFPADALDLSPVWMNVFENPALAQFDHRMIAYALVVLAVLFVARVHRMGHFAIRRWVRLAGLVVFLQTIVGIATVMHAAPLSLALVHQAGALVLVAVLIRARAEIAYPGEQKISA